MSRSQNACVGKGQAAAVAATAAAGHCLHGFATLTPLASTVVLRRACLQPDLDAKARVRQETRLAELQQQVVDHQRREQERKFAVRYHKARSLRGGGMRWGGCLCMER